MTISMMKFLNKLLCLSLLLSTGLKLRGDSPEIQYSTHRSIGIALFSLATVQVFAMFLRPKPEHKHRLYWNIYHHSIGYTLIILGVMNVFISGAYTSAAEC